ncbi:VWA domain-containing protein [Pirellulaceae bacterium]|jgi:Ca-activated chloride channel family protein|nr:VWA domain-containing protein [bacterium]MDB4640569.1 VWA domain-containing protein [Pirellulaceae bacterium]
MPRTIQIFALVLTLLVSSTIVAAEQVKLDVGTDYGKRVVSDKKQTVWVRVGLTGFKMESEKKRAAVNVAIVLDRSGSMQGDKIKKAKEAAISAVDRLASQDIVSVITYDSNVQVLVPATKATDKAAIKEKIASITIGGNTALFAGVSKGAAEVRKFLDEEKVNRIILLSDGLANVGPSSPGELGALGVSLMKDQIAVSTLGLGLGYNEDLMMKLALKSGGNHVFIENASELADIFNKEFDDVMSVVAQNVRIKIQVPEGIRPVRVLGNDADINGQNVETKLAQIYSEQDRFILLELELPAGEVGQKMDISNVTVSYRNMKLQADDVLTGKTAIEFCKTEKEYQASMNRVVLEDVVAMVANEQSKMATVYLDNGDLKGCIECLNSNGKWLQENSVKLKSKKLKLYYTFNNDQLNQILDNKTNLARKGMRAVQLQNDNQQRYQQKTERDKSSGRKR